MFTPYPTRDQMLSAAMYFAPLLRGSPPDDLNKAINAGYTIEGFVFDQVFPVDDGGASTQSVMSREQAAETLEHMATGAITAQAVPWQLFLPIVQELLTEFIRRRRQKQPA